MSPTMFTDDVTVDRPRDFEHALPGSGPVALRTRSRSG
jgi:hypothetical protein